ncbi:MAG: hypothetical protein JSV90_00455 [Methanobacteriota archaeon]|nr:MAG: hypothetical protein JSV90_00455 [Euryarchaeota archaeon]
MSDEDKKEHTDAEELKEVLQVVSTEIPKLLEGITKMMYDTQNAENLGKSVSKFYKELVDAGMDPNKAAELTEKFMANMSIGGIIGQALGSASHSDIGESIKNKIKKEMMNDDD